MTLHLLESLDPPVPFSAGTLANPIEPDAIDITGEGGTITTATVPAWIRASDYLYTGCFLVPNDSPSVNWQVSLDAIDWVESLDLAEMLPGQCIAVHLRCLVDNSGSVKPGVIDVAGIGLLGNEWSESAGPETYLHVVGVGESQPFSVSDGAYFVLSGG
jgi:hypothetical protein